MEKEERCQKVVEVRRTSDRVITVVVLVEDALRFICEYAPLSRGSLVEGQSFLSSRNMSGICILQMI